MRTSAYLLTPGDYEGFIKVRPGTVVAPGPYLDNGEALRLEATTTDSSGTLRLFGRLLTMDGELVESFQDLVFSGTGAQTAVDMRMGRGWLIGFSVRVVSGTITDGEVQASVHLVRNTGSLAQHLACLASGEVTNTRALGLGAFNVRGPSSVTATLTPETPAVTVGSDPAAGAEWSATVPASTVWKVYAVRAGLVTDATVSNRVPALVIDDGTNVFYQANVGAAHVASTTVNYTWGNFGVRDSSTSSTAAYVVAGFPVYLGAGYRIRSSTLNLQAGDNWGAPVIFYSTYTV